MTGQTPTEPRITATRGRPIMVSGYGIPSELNEDTALTWDWVREQCTSARSYWIATTRPDGRPHAMPVWALWFDETVVFSTDPGSVKGRNITSRPYVVIHLESGDEVVILEGTVEQVTDIDALTRFADAYNAKYNFRPDPGEAHANGSVYALRIETALAWLEKDFLNSAVRWRFR